MEGPDGRGRPFEPFEPFEPTGPTGRSEPRADWRDAPRLAAVLAELAPLAQRFAAAGHRLYLVGGTVRDLVAGDERDEFDLDATTTARPPEIKRLLQGWADAIWTQGERFGTIGATKRITAVGAAGGGEPVERVFEITTHRAEAYRGHSRKPDVRFSDDVVADLSRRDFTVNAMAIEVTAPAGAAVAEPVLVDPFDGVGDLARRVLRTPLTPAESFSDDPLRMLRAARFVTRYALAAEPDLVAAVAAMRGRLAIVSAERVRDELDKLLRCPLPAAGLRFVLDTGIAGEVLPELSERAIDVVARIASSSSSARSVRWAALFEAVGAATATARMRALRASSADVGRVTRLVTLRDRWFAVSGSVVDAAAAWSDGEVRHLVHDADDALDELLVLEEARAAVADDGSDGDGARGGRVTSLLAAIERLRAAGELDALEPELDGAAVMDALGIGPGREVGRALAFVLELRLTEGRLGTDEVVERLRRWWHHEHR